MITPDRAKLLLAAIALALGLTSPHQPAQADICTTPSPAEDYLTDTLGKTSYVSSISSATLRLFFHRHVDSGFSENDTQAFLDHLRQEFGPHDIFFQLVGSEETTAGGIEVIGNAPSAGAHSDAIDVYFFPALDGDGAGNSITIPSDRVLLRSSQPNVLVHEMGHVLGLYHTFESFELEGVETCPGDSTCSENIERPPDPNANCGPNDGGCGDKVCDTPADPCSHLYENATCGSWSPPPLLQGYTPLLTNHMSYAGDSPPIVICHDHFTQGQVDRMFSMIEESPILQPIVVPMDAQYANRSSVTGITYPEGNPYSAVGFDYNGDGTPQDEKVDLMVSLDVIASRMFMKDTETPGTVPVFANETTEAFQSTLPEIGLRGLTTADYDNDGDLDFFAAHATNPQLFRNDGGEFTEVTSSAGLGADADSSWAGAWGDYDGDGWLDLYVVRAGGDGTPTDITGAQDHLFRSNVATGGGFTKVTAATGLDDWQTEAVSASWVDVTHDGKLDLFVGRLSAVDSNGTGHWSRLFINQGNGTFSEQAETRLGTIGYVNGSSWADLNQDGYLDIILAREHPIGGNGVTNNALVCFGDAQGNINNEPQASDLFGVETQIGLVGLMPLDYDLNGVTDLVAVPRNSTDPALLFAGFESSTGIQYVERGELAHLDVGGAEGIVAADWNDDGDLDLYLGRPDVGSFSEFYYQNKATDTQDTPVNHWLGIRLQSPSGPNNLCGVGATVKAVSVSTGLTQVQLMDGGSSRGGQSPLLLTFGLGPTSSDVDIVVTWPDGYIQTTTVPSVFLDRVVTITDPGDPVIVPGSFNCMYQPAAGNKANWVFSWLTESETSPANDKVVVKTSARQPAGCQIPQTTLTDSRSDVTVTVVPQGGDWLHTLTWLDQDCVAVCKYDGQASSRNSTTAWKTLTIGVCTL